MWFQVCLDRVGLQFLYTENLQHEIVSINNNQKNSTAVTGLQQNLSLIPHTRFICMKV